MMLDLVPDVADARAWQLVMLPDDSLLIRRRMVTVATAELVEAWRRGGSLRRVQALATALRSGGWVAGWRMADLAGDHWPALLVQLAGALVDGISGARIQLLRIRWCQPELVAGQWAGSDLIQARAYLTEGQAYRNASSAEVGQLITEATELVAAADRITRWAALSDGPDCHQQALEHQRRQSLDARYQALEDQLADLLHVSQNVPCGTSAEVAG
jgi:hypothetical protein